MDIVEFRDYCLSKPGVTEGFPFDDKVLVFKVANKIFALTDVDAFVSINLKCRPDYALELRERYTSVKPGYHMNKKHWNTVETDGDLPVHLLVELIDMSYDLVYQSLPKKVKDQLQ
jgi:predicted DNA-binding protein (MmcQ/YjbR family)